MRTIARRLTVVATVVTALLLIAGPVSAGKPTSFDSEGNGKAFVTDAGFDAWGYNYRAHLFSGGYCDAYKNAAWCQPYVDDDLIMKWNEAWLSNLDQDGDSLLDRHYGYPSYRGSGAWLTNHQSGEYEGVNGEACAWTYFVKIVAAPADASLTGGSWYAADGTGIGYAIWGEFAVIQEILNDQCTGDHGILYLSPNSAGFGAYGPRG